MTTDPQFTEPSDDTEAHPIRHIKPSDDVEAHMPKIRYEPSDDDSEEPRI